MFSVLQRVDTDQQGESKGHSSVSRRRRHRSHRRKSEDEIEIERQRETKRLKTDLKKAFRCMKGLSSSRVQPCW